MKNKISPYHRNLSVLELLSSSKVQRRRFAFKKIEQPIDSEVASRLINLLENEPDRQVRTQVADILKLNLSQSDIQIYLETLFTRLESASHTQFFHLLGCLRLLSKISDQELVQRIQKHFQKWKSNLPAGNQIFRDYEGNFELKPATFWAIGPIKDSSESQKLLNLLQDCLCEVEGEYISSRFRYLILRLLEQTKTSLHPDLLYKVIQTERFHDVYVHAVGLLNNINQLDTADFWQAIINRWVPPHFHDLDMSKSFVKHFSAVQEQVFKGIISEDYTAYKYSSLIGQTWGTEHWSNWSKYLEDINTIERFRFVSALAGVEFIHLKVEKSGAEAKYQLLLKEFLSDPDPDIRKRAVHASLRLMSSEEIEMNAEIFLNDPEPIVRLEVYSAFFHLGFQNNSRISWFVRGVGDIDPQVQIFCLEHMFYIINIYNLCKEEVSLIPEQTLVNAAQQENQELKILAWLALLKQKPDQVNRLLYQIFSTSSELLTIAFLQKFSQLWGRSSTRVELSSETINVLLPLIMHSDVTVAKDVINALSSFSGKPLKRILQERLDIEERYQIHRALSYSINSITEYESGKNL